jgi:hypothetical protein
MAKKSARYKIEDPKNQDAKPKTHAHKPRVGHPAKKVPASEGGRYKGKNAGG